MSNNPLNSSTPDDVPPAPVDLSPFDDEYKAVEPADIDDLPDGRYQLRVQSVKLDYSQKGDPMLKWDLVVLAGPHANRHIFKNAVITQASLPLVKASLQTLGLVLERFSDLPHRLDELLNLTLEVSKRTKGEYANVYFKKLIQSPTGDAGVPDRVPF
jgi:hypothetical protein